MTSSGQVRKAPDFRFRKVGEEWRMAWG